MSKTRTLEVRLELPIPNSFEVAWCRIEEAPSATTRAILELATTEDLDLDGVLAEDALVTLIVDGLVERTWALQVGCARFLSAKHDSLRFAVELFSADHLLRFTTDTRKYRKMTAHQIVSDVLGRSRVAHRWQTTRDTPRRNYCVQYRETNYDFVRRLLEFEGIYYTFDEEGTMVLADRSSASPPIAGVAHFELHEAEGALTDGEEGVHDLRRGARVRSGKVTVNDFDWKKPSTRLIRSNEAARDTDLEVYEYPAGYRNLPDGDHLAQIRLEALRAEARYIHGRSSVGRFAPMHTFSFGATGGVALAGEYLLTRVVHFFKHPMYMPASPESRGDTRYVYKNDFQSIPRDVPHRPLCVTPHPNVDGYHTAIVRGPAGEEIHTDKYGRFRAQFHWDREAKGTDEDSRWLRVVQESASSMFLARVGWEMTIAYIDGDPDRPIGLGRNINRIMPPAYAQPAKKNVMTIKTPTSPRNGGFNEIRLDDSAAAQEFYVKAERDFLNIVRNDRSEVVGVNETRSVGNMLQETVERDQRTVVGGNATFETMSMHELRVQQNRDDTVAGNETVDVKASAATQVRGDDTESVGGSRVTQTGSSISRSGKLEMTRVVGGSQVIAAQGNVITSANQGFTEIVSGSKITAAQNGTIAQSVMGPLATTVMGSVMRTAGTDMSYSAENTFVTVGASASFTASEKLSIESDDTIEIVAESELKLTVGRSTITLKPSSITFTGDLAFKAGYKVIVTGSSDNLTK